MRKNVSHILTEPVHFHSTGMTQVTDISKSCRAWLCKWSGIPCHFIHTVLPTPRINIDLLVTFILEKLKWKSKIRSRVKSTYLEYRSVVFPQEMWFVFVYDDECQQMPTDELTFFCLVLQSIYGRIWQHFQWENLTDFENNSYCSLRSGRIRKLCGCQYTFHDIWQSSQYFHGSIS